MMMMMMSKMLVLLLSCLLLTQESSAFAVVGRIGRTTSALSSAVSSQSESDFFALVSQAMDCTESSTCSTEEAEMLMKRLQVVKENGSEMEVENEGIMMSASEILSALRTKVDAAKKVEAWLSVEQSAVVSAVVLSALVMVATSNFGGPDRESLTLQEWWWALRGNYFPTMVVHFLKYGGL